MPTLVELARAEGISYSYAWHIAQRLNIPSGTVLNEAQQALLKRAIHPELRPRKKKVPAGFLDVERAGELAGISPAAVRKWARDGWLETVTVRWNIYVCPDSLLHAKEVLMPAPPDGWVLTTCRNQRRWLRDRGYPLEWFYPPGSNSRRMYTIKQAIWAFEQGYEPKEDGFNQRKLTMAQALELRARRAAGVVEHWLVHDFGVTATAALMCARGMTYKDTKPPDPFLLDAIPQLLPSTTAEMAESLDVEQEDISRALLKLAEQGRVLYEAEEAKLWLTI